MCFRSYLLTLVNNSVTEKYAISFYWAVITTTQVGYGDMVAHTTLEVSKTNIRTYFCRISHACQFQYTYLLTEQWSQVKFCMQCFQL